MQIFSLKRPKTIEITKIVQENKEAISWKDTWKTAIGIFLLSRAILLMLTFLSPYVFSFALTASDTYKKTFVSTNCALNIENCFQRWYRWDVAAFIDIARLGYWKPDHSLTAFFPFWPFVIRICSSLFVSTNLSFFYTGLVLTNLFFLIAWVFLYRLISDDFSPAIAANSLFLLAFNPYALFYFTDYSESLFLLLCALMFFFLKRQSHWNWWFAGFCGFLAALTRAVGITLVIPFFLIWLDQARPLWNGRNFSSWRFLLHRLLPVLLIPCGLLLYMAYLTITTGNPLEFSLMEKIHWGRELTFPWIGIMNDIISLLHPTGTFAFNFINLVFTLLPIVALCFGWKQLPQYYRYFSLSLLLLPLCSPTRGIIGPLASVPRYIVVIFPLTILYTLWGQKNFLRTNIVISSSLIFFTFNTILFLTGGWIG